VKGDIVKTVGDFREAVENGRIGGGRSKVVLHNMGEFVMAREFGCDYAQRA